MWIFVLVLVIVYQFVFWRAVSTIQREMPSWTRLLGGLDPWNYGDGKRFQAYSLAIFQGALWEEASRGLRIGILLLRALAAFFAFVVLIQFLEM